MNIVNREQFLALPENIVYSEYNPCVVHGLFIKLGNFGNNSWIYQDLISPILEGADSSSQHHDLLFKAQDDSKFNIRNDLDCSDRDGLYDEKQLFLIYDNDDIRKLINKLNETILE